MQLDRISARIAPRTAWQAMDLGTHLYRAWWRPLTLAWLGFSLPVLLLALWLTLQDHAGWGLLLLWWLKPVFERPLLEYCAQALFGEAPDQRRLWRQFPRYGLRGLLPWLLWRRIYLTRSFAVPIAHLEQQTGAAWRARCQVLNSGASNRATLLTLLLVHVEMVVSYALTVLLLMLVPGQYLLSEVDWSLSGQDHLVVALLAWYATLTILEPLYVCCGFALYLNKRTWLEGWDLELGMRRLGERRRRTLPALALAGLLALGLASPPPVSANPARDEAIEVLAGEAFSPFEIEQRWQWRDQSPAAETPDEDPSLTWLGRLLRWLFDRDPVSTDSSSLPSLADLFRVLLWALFVSLVLWLLWHYRHWLKRLPGRPATLPATIRIGGVDIDAASLPPDPLSAIRAALEQQQLREALSLLYRCTLVRLAAREDFRLPPGATEQEALQHCRRHHPDRATVDLLARITPLWIRTAWGHRAPDPDQIDALIEDWQQLTVASAAGEVT